MAAPVSMPHCPFDRLWQPGHPFRPRRSKKRRWTMAVLLIFMSAVISSYWYLTDPTRIRQMSQAYLSELVGGHVEVGSASLTIFEGLKLSKVSVKVDKSGPADDTTVFFADAIEIQYNPASLLRGRLEATRIIATGAKVKLVEESVAGRWNYQRLVRPQPGKPAVTRPSEKPQPLLLPQLVLRDAQVEYSEVQGDQCVPRGSIGIEGRLFPSQDNSLYAFELQSRGQTEGVGPVVAGQVTLKTGQVVATLNHLHFGPDVEAMLPREVRDFWVAHRVHGALDINEFSYTPALQNQPVKFRLQIDLKNVDLIVRSEEFDPPAREATASKGPPPSPWDIPARLVDLGQQAELIVRRLHVLPQRPPITVTDVSGGFYFDDGGIRFDKVTGSIAGATLSVSGKIDGYSPDAPIWIRVESRPGQLINIPEHPDFLPALPGPLQQAYNMLKPQGTGTMWAELNRSVSNGFPQVTGEIDIADGAFTCIFFPYPIHGAQGKVVFAPDPSHTFEKVTMENIRGHGKVGGPNEHATFWLNGWVGAMNPDVGCQIRAQAQGIISEPAVFAAFPPPVRKVMDIFRGPGKEIQPHFTGDFDCIVFVPPGVNMRPIVSVDLDFKEGSGRLTAFPYPLEHMKGQVAIRDGYLDVKDVSFHHNNASVSVNGRVTWPTDLPGGQEVIAKPDLQLVARNVPMDVELLRVLPIEARSWLHSAGASGLLDVDGHVTAKPNATAATDSIAYDLSVLLHDGAAHPVNTDYSIANLDGKLMVHTDRLEVLELHGKRGNTDLAASGTVNWSTGSADVNLDGSGKNLQLEPALRDLLPADARQAWTALDPHGLLDASVHYHGVWPASKPDAIASVDLPPDSIITPPPPLTSDFHVKLHPLDVTVTPAPLPYKLEHCVGDIEITPQQTIINGIDARHGQGAIQLSGMGVTSNPNIWDFTVKAKNLPADDELKKALPLPVRTVLDEMKYTGNLSLDLRTMRYRGDKPDPDVDLNGTLTFGKGAVDVGVPVEKIEGAMTFNALVRSGKLAEYRGEMAISQMTIADRPVTDFQASMYLPANSDTLRIGNIRGFLAGGDLSGLIDLKFPDQGPSTYLLNFAVRNADLREMAKQVAPKGQEIRGQVSASLALQGQWTNSTTRLGRGDVLIAGKEMYQIPLMLGLLEVTNLSLPTSTPFNEGTARYLVDGDRITFEQVQMRSPSIVMNGNGWLDFGSKQVRMNFTTENPNLPQVPLLHDLLEGAKQELLQIQVRGTVQSPKVSAAALHTFTTTVDEVLSGSGKEK